MTAIRVGQADGQPQARQARADEPVPLIVSHLTKPVFGQVYP
jgi:hypothetical protein